MGVLANTKGKDSSGTIVFALSTEPNTGLLTSFTQTSTAWDCDRRAPRPLYSMAYVSTELACLSGTTTTTFTHRHRHLHLQLQPHLSCLKR